MSKQITFLTLILILIIGLMGVRWFLSGTHETELVLKPQKKIAIEVPESRHTAVRTGWGMDADSTRAVLGALDMLFEKDKEFNPEFAAVYANSGTDLVAVLREVKARLGRDVKIYGGTSDLRGVMTNKGYIGAAEKGYAIKGEEKSAVAILAVNSKKINFGSAAAVFDSSEDIAEKTKTAYRAAVAGAGMPPSDQPRVILIMPTYGTENQVISAIEETAGTNIPILGGTTGGPDFGVFGDEVIERGVSLAVLYTNLPVGWIYEGGFDVTPSRSGLVTKVDGQRIMEIDNRPALDVYNEWLGGEITRLYSEIKDPTVIRDLLVLHPIYRKYVSRDGQDYFLFSHPWPEDDTLQDKSIMSSTNIHQGERIYLSHGTWGTFMNRIGLLPLRAKAQAGLPPNSVPVFGLGYICGGVLGVIPASEREKISYLINDANIHAPFITAFTWGEQGYFPGIGSKHGNLLTSFVVIGDDGR